MKKTYMKPCVLLELFSLSTSIAGGCEEKTNTPNSGNCALEWEDEFLGTVHIFTTDVSACIEKNDGYHNGFCYHVPTETNNLFNS